MGSSSSSFLSPIFLHLVTSFPLSHSNIGPKFLLCRRESSFDRWKRAVSEAARAVCMVWNGSLLLSLPSSKTQHLPHDLPQYRGEINPWVKGALLVNLHSFPFPPLPSGYVKGSVRVLF